MNNNNGGDDFEDDLAAYNERQKEEDGDNLSEQQPVSAISEFNPVISNKNLLSDSLSKVDQNLEDIESEQPQPKNRSEKEDEEEEEDEEGFYKDEEEETPVSVQEMKPIQQSAIVQNNSKEQTMSIMDALENSLKKENQQQKEI